MTSISNMDIFGNLTKVSQNKPNSPNTEKNQQNQSVAKPPQHKDSKAEGYLNVDQMSDFLDLHNARNFAKGTPAAIGGMVTAFPIEKSIIRKELQKNAAGENKTEEKDGFLRRFRLFADEGNRYELITGSTLNLREHFVEGGTLGCALAFLFNFTGIKVNIPFLTTNSQKTEKIAEGLLTDGKRYLVRKTENGSQHIFKADIIHKIMGALNKNPVAKIVTDKDGNKIVTEFAKDGKNVIQKIIFHAGNEMGSILNAADEVVKTFNIQNGLSMIHADVNKHLAKKSANITQKPVIKNSILAFGYVLQERIHNIGRIFERPINKFINGFKSDIMTLSGNIATESSEIITHFAPSAIENLKKQKPNGLSQLISSIPSIHQLAVAFTFGGIAALLYNLFEHGAVQIQMPGVSTGGHGHGE